MVQNILEEDICSYSLSVTINHRSTATLKKVEKEKKEIRLTDSLMTKTPIPTANSKIRVSSPIDSRYYAKLLLNYANRLAILREIFPLSLEKFALLRKFIYVKP